MENELRDRLELELKRAWWTLLDEELKATPPKWDHLKVVLKELHEILCSLVPNRWDIHEKIYEDLLETPPTVVLQERALYWIKRLQSPHWDSYVTEWEKRLPEDTIVFLKEYYIHLDTVKQDVEDYKEKMRSPQTVNGIGNIRMRTGR